jgi:hypothetical protein
LKKADICPRRAPCSAEGTCSSSIALWVATAATIAGSLNAMLSAP